MSERTRATKSGGRRKEQQTRSFGSSPQRTPPNTQFAVCCNAKSGGCKSVYLPRARASKGSLSLARTCNLDGVGKKRDLNDSRRARTSLAICLLLYYDMQKHSAQCSTHPPTPPAATALALINWQIITCKRRLSFPHEIFSRIPGVCSEREYAHLHRSHTFQPRDPFSQERNFAETQITQPSLARVPFQLAAAHLCTRLLTRQTKYVCFHPRRMQVRRQTDARPRATT